MDSATLGELVRRRRKAKALSQEDLAEQFGVHQATITKWERGARIGTTHLPGLAKFLGMPLAEVLRMYHGSDDVSFEKSVEEILQSTTSTRAQLDQMQALLGQIDGKLTTLTSHLVPDARQPDEPASRRRRRVGQASR